MSTENNVCSVEEILRFEEKDFEVAKTLGYGDILTPSAVENALKTPEIQAKLTEIQQMCQRVGVRVSVGLETLLGFLQKVLKKSAERSGRAGSTEFEPTTLEAEEIVREFFASDVLSVEERWKLRRRRSLTQTESSQSFVEESGIFAFGGREFM